jgi:hypothetical protein
MWYPSHPCQLGRIGQWVVKVPSFKYEVGYLEFHRELCHVYDTDAHIPDSSILYEFLTVYEDPDTHQRLDPILSALSDSREENLFPGILCKPELCNSTLYMIVDTMHITDGKHDHSEEFQSPARGMTRDTKWPKVETILKNINEICLYTFVTP